MTQTQASPRLVELINEASKQAGNQSKLAELVADSRQNLSAWKNGARACPLDAQVIMGSIIGSDIDEVIRAALIEQAQGTARGEKLKSALKKASMLAGVALPSMTFGIDGLAANLPHVLRCILWLL